MSKASDQAYAFIRSEILAGHLAPGMQLKEEHLAASCGVSRTPVRDALRRLENEHFIRRTESQRTFVADWSLDEVEEAFILRGMLESYAAARAASRIDEKAIEKLTTINEQIKASTHIEAVDAASFIENNRSFHATILEAAKSPRLVTLLTTAVEQPIITRTARQYDRAQLMQSYLEHDELLQAFRRRDPAWAQAVMKAHIRRAFHAYRDAYDRANTTL